MTGWVRNENKAMDSEHKDKTLKRSVLLVATFAAFLTPFLGAALGPIIGGLLTQYFGWKSIFAFLIPFGIFSLILIRRKIKTEWAEASGEKFDWKGSVVYGLALFSFMYGFSKLPSLFGWVCLSAGIVLTFLFFITENLVNNPVFDFKL